MEQKNVHGVQQGTRGENNRVGGESLRRMFSIAIIALIIFLGAYGVFRPVKEAVDGFILNTAGPSVYNALNALYLGILGTVGIGGFAALVLGFGFLAGVVMHWGWVKADWRIRRWGHTRTARDLGVTPVTPIRTTTPTGATTRPSPTQVAPAPAAQPEPEPVADTKTEETEKA